MKRTRPVLAGLLGALLVAGCGGSGKDDAVGPDFDVVVANVTGRVDPKLSDRKDIDKAADATAAFALDMYQQVSADLKGKNVVLGPYSAWLALSMLAVGSKGKTAEELSAVLHHPFDGERLLQALNALERTIVHRSDDDKLTLRNNAQIFGAPGQEFVPDFLDAMAGHFGAPLATVDFSDAERARLRINEWVKERTEGKIPDLLPAGTITPDIRVVLVNAMYLDAPWEFSLDPKMTQDGSFTKADGSTVKVPFMYYDEYLPSAHGKGYSAVELPYEGGGLSMVIVLPQPTYETIQKGDSFESKETPAPTLDELVKSLDAAGLEKLLAGLEENGIHLSLPRFTFSTHRDMLEDVQDLGAPTAIGGGDYTGIIPGGFQLRFIEHEAFIQVDEYGTKAAAATAAGGGLSHGPSIYVDHPFLFLIRDRATNAILFIGRVMDPNAH